MRTLVIVGLAVTVLAVGGPASAASSRSSDQALADAAVLAQNEVPPVFIGGPVDDPGPAAPLPECRGAIARADRSVEASPRARSSFELDPGFRGTALIENVVAVLPTQKRAKQAMAAYARRAATRCMQARLEQAFTDAGTTAAADLDTFAPDKDDKGKKTVIEGGDDFLGFRGFVERTADGAQAPQRLESQVVLARDGRVVTRMIMVASGTIPSDDVQKMLQTVVGRMAGA